LGVSSKYVSNYYVGIIKNYEVYADDDDDFEIKK
jgi:hypothetical protein